MMMFFHLPDVGSIIPKETSCSSTTDFTSLRVPFSRMPNTCKHIVQIVVKSRGKKWKATKRKLQFLPLYVSSVVGCLWWSSSSSLHVWNTLLTILFSLKPSFQNPDIVWPNLQLMSSSRNMTIHCFPFWVSPPQQANQTLCSSTQVAGLVSLEMISFFWPKDYWVIASLSIGINTIVFPSCEGPHSSSSFRMNQCQLLWLLVGSAIYLLTWINTSESTPSIFPRITPVLATASS